MAISAPEKPRWTLIGLRTNRSGNQENNAAIVDHYNVTNLQVWLNHSKYPSVDMARDFDILNLCFERFMTLPKGSAWCLIVLLNVS